MCSGYVYEPSEDSYLLQRWVEREVRGQVLDVGTGSGIQAISAARKPSVTRVIAVDSNPVALDLAQENARGAGLSDRIVFRQSDLFERVQESFDFILFNAPYLPSEPQEALDEASRAWDGGPSGAEAIRRFLSEAGAHLKRGGRILLVFSSLTGLTLEEFAEYYVVEILEEEPLFFERLFCVLLGEKHVSV